MLALSTANCAIPKIINYCKLRSTYHGFIRLNTLRYAELQFWRVFLNSNLGGTLIYNILLSIALSNYNLLHWNITFNSIGTQHYNCNGLEYFPCQGSTKAAVRLYNLHRNNCILNKITRSPDSGMRKISRWHARKVDDNAWPSLFDPFFWSFFLRIHYWMAHKGINALFEQP